ncbi:DUF6266 family protein [Pedobacter heparinus]|uniref:Uncharacterized protein n=2 Tax=Pedobacter TaxID=84567 RepID=C6XWS4_PEDHD|nr:DUF6266 family protein [Pedobacter heparinus]ACU04218.1 hypothetical protein Phep_2013 [Pedobacter heparinus DSM 2366]
MGKYKKGILGPFRGKVGTTVGSSWNGIFYLKSLPDFGDYVPSTAQLNVQAKMAFVTGFLKPLKPLLNIGYKLFNKGITPMNAATSYHLKNAVTGTSALNYAIDYTKVMISEGNLPVADDPEVNVTVANQLNFSWVDDSDPESTNDTDMLTVLAINPTKGNYTKKVNAVPRSAQAYVLPVPGYSGDEVQVYLFFVSADGKQVSDSVYVGEFIVL